MTDGLESIIKNYVDQVERARTDLSAYVDQAGNEIAGRVDDSTGRLYSRLDDVARTIQVGIEENSNSMVERLTATTELASNTIGTSGSKLESIIKTYIDHVDRARGGLETYVDEAGLHIAGRLDDTADRLFAKLDETAQTINVGVAENTH